MKVAEIKHVEDCLDGSIIKEVLLEKEISPAFIEYLGKKGTDFQYFKDFAKPFFKIDYKGKYALKGVEGGKTIRLTLKDTEDSTLREFLDTVSCFSDEN